MDIQRNPFYTSWNYGPYYGGSVVDKPTGNVYLGQGFNYPTGFQVIRINTAGLYDNYITTPNGNFTENWKMYWSCNNGTPQILIAGGGINSNVNFGIFTLLLQQYRPWMLPVYPVPDRILLILLSILPITICTLLMLPSFFPRSK